MNEIRSLLQALPFFGRLTPSQLEEGATVWSTVSLKPGEVLWSEGEAAAGLAVVVAGGVSVSVGGVEVARLGEQALLGESSAFFAGVSHTTTIRAVEPAVLLVLSQSALMVFKARRTEERATLDGLAAWDRQGRAPVYTILLEQALQSSTRRVRSGMSELTHPAAMGKMCPSRERVGVISRLWRASKLGLPNTQSPPLAPMMRLLPPLGGESETVLTALTRLWKPEKFERGHIFFLEGDPSDSAYLLVEGAVGEMACQSVGKAVQLRTLEPGGLFGDNGLIEQDSRTFSCIASKPGWAYRVEPESFRRFRASSELGILWTETLLIHCIAKLRLVNLCHTSAEVLGGTNEDLDHGQVDFSSLLIRPGRVSI
ncbi:MAG: CRP-like cAMP-binding protein [Myxococcota bacterium]|jgi:CRP-like cAMP-binding protein